MNRQIVVSCDGVSGDFGTRSYDAWSVRADLLQQYARRLGFQVDIEHFADTDDSITPVGRKAPVPALVPDE